MAEHQTFDIEDHILAALSINPDAAGEPVILVHGITGNIATWQVNPLPSVLEQGPCYALSLPGHFPAAFPPGFKQEHLTADMLARTMAEAIRWLVGERPVTLMGQSTGGFAVLSIAARYPELVRRIICVSGFTRGRWNGFLGFNQKLIRMGPLGKAAFKSIYRLAGRNPWIFKLALGLYAAEARRLYANPKTAAALERSLDYFQKLDLEAMAQFFAAMPGIDISSWLPNIRVPALVIASDGDPTVPSEEARKLASLIPGAELAIIPGNSHLSFLERPAEYRAALADWLEKTK